MNIDQSRTGKEILEDIYKHTINNLGIDFGFKPDCDFEEWYNQSDQYVFFPHPGIPEAELAESDSRYPVVYIRYDNAKIETGIVFNTSSAVDENLLGILNSKHKKNKKWLLDNLKDLNPKWEWKFSISRNKSLAANKADWVKNCLELDPHGLSDALYMLNQIRIDENSGIEGTGNAPPSVKFISTYVESEDYDTVARIIFERFNYLNETISLPVLKKQWQMKKKKIEEFIVNLEERLNTSQYSDAIEVRIVEQKNELEKLNAVYCMA